MGAWGAGLYSNDDAADFVELVRAVLKLPHPINELVELLRTEAEIEVGDETTFWLVLADQLEKKGLHHSKVSNEAIAILESDVDISEMRNAGADESDLKARRKSNAKLLARLTAPRKERPRKTLTKPQPAAVKTGDYICFPTQKGAARNPYFPSGKENFVQDGWGLIQIHDVGWEFGYLNWVRLFPLQWRYQHCPTLKDASRARPSSVLGFGTLSVTHFKRMQMTVLGNETPRSDALPGWPHDRTSRVAALNDISVSNMLMRLC